MAVTIEDIKKLRAMTGAGMKDCKKALAEANGDIDKAVELVRERGLAIAAKRSDRAIQWLRTREERQWLRGYDRSEVRDRLRCQWCRLYRAHAGDPDLAIAAKAHTLDEVKELKTKDGITVAEAVTRRSGVVGEKMELDGYNVLEGANISVYDHMRKHTLATMVQLSDANDEAGYKVAMQVAAMKPVALDEASVPQSVKDEELRIAIEKTKEEQVERQINGALKKAGINPNLVDSDDHIASNVAKGWLSQEDADKAQQIRKEVAETAAANLKEQMIQNIAKGRMAKFFKENCLVDQEFQFGDEGAKESVAQWLDKQQKGLKVVAFKRFSLSAD